jgi:hypothetical protein
VAQTKNYIKQNLKKKNKFSKKWKTLVYNLDFWSLEERGGELSHDCSWSLNKALECRLSLELSSHWAMPQLDHWQQGQSQKRFWAGPSRQGMKSIGSTRYILGFYCPNVGSTVIDNEWATYATILLFFPLQVSFHPDCPRQLIDYSLHSGPQRDPANIPKLKSLIIEI